ncbi:trypco2 family protein [Catenulispora rubra]|uniref:trypco2 family protein n=1 Tax=Catenulispora rubra TaxID=280293 RepID=UPI001892888C|nr:trypco2 family protein [Catenulispora rubra]
MEIGLVEAIARIREELTEAVSAGQHADIRFPVGEVTIQFQVGMTKSDEDSGKIKLWVLEFGAKGTDTQESMQTISMVLGPPVDAQGKAIQVSSTSSTMPG